MPKLSIITINLNNLAGLRKTMQSVFEQTFTDYEYIIIDGGSTDGSEEFIKKHEKKLVYWLSEKDSGVYNAMNKGIAKAKGDYIQFLNSGDELVSNSTLNFVANSIRKFPEIDFFYSDVVNSENKTIHQYPQKLSFKYFFELTINHQSVFFKTSLFHKYGLYNEEYKIVSDWEFFLKILFLHGCSYHHLSEPVVLFDYTYGMSTAPGLNKLMEDERSDVLRKLFPNLIDDYFFFQYVERSNTWKWLQKINRIKNRVKR